MATVAQIWRYPIKSHGREALQSVPLSAGKTLPWDRHWAVAHENSTADGSVWVPCQNFSRGAKAPLLMAITSHWDAHMRQMHIRHPNLPDLQFNPDDAGDQKRFLKWSAPLMPENRAKSARLIRAAECGLTDTDYPSISIGNLSSHRAVSQKLGRDLSVLRWRTNIWLDGLAPWEEFDWVGRIIEIGEVQFEICERGQRCLATTANPETGRRDADTLSILQTWDHQDFCVYARVLNAGTIHLNNSVKAPNP